MRMLTEQPWQMEMALGSINDQEHNKWDRQTGHGVLEVHEVAVCVTVCTGWHSHPPNSWWFLPAQLEQIQRWFPHGRKPSLDGAWRPRWSSIRNMQLPWSLAVGSIEPDISTRGQLRCHLCAVWPGGWPAQPGGRAWSGEPEEYQGVRDWWNCTLPSLGNAADGSFVRVRGIQTLLSSGRRKGPNRPGEMKTGPCLETSRSSFWPPVPLQVSLQNRRYEAPGTWQWR